MSPEAMQAAEGIHVAGSACDDFKSTEDENFFERDFGEWADMGGVSPKGKLKFLNIRRAKDEMAARFKDSFAFFQKLERFPQMLNDMRTPDEIKPGAFKRQRFFAQISSFEIAA